MLIYDRSFFFLIKQLIIQLRNKMKLESFKQGKATMTQGMFVRLCLSKKQSPIVTVDLSKQKQLHGDPSAIKQIEFYRMLKSKSQICTTLRIKTKKF